MKNTITRHGKRRMRYKNKDDALRLAAAILGKKGGSMRTEKQFSAHSACGKKNILKANAALTGSTPEETKMIRRSVQLSIPEADRIVRAKNAVTARWKSRPEAMSSDEFRERTSGKTAAEIADMLGVTAVKVSSWRRSTKPVRIVESDAETIREKFPLKN